MLLLFSIIFFSCAFFLRAYSHVPDEVTDSASSTSFASEPVSVDRVILSGAQADTGKKTPVRIVIPDLNIDVPVKPARIVNGYWEVFQDSAGFGLGSSYPEDTGNQVIFAHARVGLFLPLKNVKTESAVYVFTQDKWFRYTVKEIKEVLPTQKEVIAATSDATLTLYTCTGFADSKRLIIVAKRITE